MTLKTRGLALGVLCAASAAALADEKPHWTIWAGPASSVKFLGSEDVRVGGYYGIQYSRPDPRVHFRGEDGEFVIEAYHLFTKGGGFNDKPVDNSFAYGAIAIARYWPKSWSQGDWNAYYEAGIGLQHQSQSTTDLNEHWNFTPLLGAGLEYEASSNCSVMLGIRLLHISNGGLRPPNQGQNQLLFMTGVRF